MSAWTRSPRPGSPPPSASADVDRAACRFHGGIDDGGSGELALSVASSHPLLDFPEDVGHVEVPLPAPVTSAGDLQRAAASAMEELGPDARHGSSCPDYRKLNNSSSGSS